MKFEVLRGRKSENDKLVKIWSYGEILAFGDLLKLLDYYFKSEDGYYPKPRYLGSTMLLEAIIEIYSGFSVEQVLEKYKLKRKGSKSVWIENVGKEAKAETKPIEKDAAKMPIADFM